MTVSGVRDNDGRTLKISNMCRVRHGKFKPRVSDQ